MRSTTVAFIALLFMSSLSAQTLHQATPLDELLKQIHSHHHLVAEMDAAAPAKAPDGFNASAAKAFTIVAHQFDFTISPEPFIVNQGDSVTLDVTSSDVTHGFFLERYMTSDITMNKNQHRTVSFVASTPGTFTFLCTVSSCGSGHGNMVGDMVVMAAAAPPTISSFTPTSGPTAGGTVVAIAGTNFVNGASVKFGTTAAVSVTVNSSTSISAITPAHSAGAVTITVTNPDGNSAAASDSYTYPVPGPAITSITPATGSTAGGTAITIAGTNFASGATVTIGGVSATGVSVLNSTTINATTPLGPFDISSSSARDVVVTNPDGTSVTRSGGFTYTLPAPVISSISPNAASPNGGSLIVITGAGFTTGLPVSVTFGGVAGTGVQVTSPVTFTVTAPAHAAGTVDVVVTVGSARATSTGGFSYQTPGKKRRAVKLM